MSFPNNLPAISDTLLNGPNHALLPVVRPISACAALLTSEATPEVNTMAPPLTSSLSAPEKSASRTFSCRVFKLTFPATRGAAAATDPLAVGTPVAAGGASDKQKTSNNAASPVSGVEKLRFLHGDPRNA